MKIKHRKSSPPTEEGKENGRKERKVSTLSCVKEEKSRRCVALNFPPQWIPIRRHLRWRNITRQKRRRACGLDPPTYLTSKSLPLLRKFFFFSRISSPGLAGFASFMLHNAHTHRQCLQSSHEKEKNLAREGKLFFFASPSPSSLNAQT